MANDKNEKSREEKILEHKKRYRRVLNRELNLANPKDFNEKIQWLMLNYYGGKEGRLADKEMVKSYVSGLAINGLRIPKTLKTYNDSNDIDLDELPEKFVLKCNHFSGDVFICKDKKKFDIEAAKKRLDEILKKDFADINLEYHYSFIKPLIMAEEYLDDGKHKNPVDYKFYCFNGKAESILLCSDRENGLRLDEYDLDWNKLDYTTDDYKSGKVFKKPKNLKKMIRIAEKLSVGLPFVRVDLYEIGDEVFFGEYTFTPAAGLIEYYNQRALNHLGGKIDLGQYKRIIEGCDIVVPIFNAFDCLSDCIDSILNNTDFSNNRLILIDDKSTDKRVLPLLEKYKKENKDIIILLKNEKNLGFVKTVNRGMKYSEKNVALLNSDTVVSDGWLERMVKCCEKDAGVATVTPFSNNLTPMEPLPESFRKKGFPNGYDFNDMAKLIKNCSLRFYPEIPTANGFCMYIKRDVLDTVGYFDEENFDKGYGEENDFCFRCLECGYKHVLCDDVYVFHMGTQSFLEKKKMHDEVLAEKHPEVMKKVGAWYEKKDIKRVTDNVILALGARYERVNVLVVTKNGIGTEDYKVIGELRKKYNIHALEEERGNYVLHSFFKDVDLKTAIYGKPIVFCGYEIDSKEYRRMIKEIVDIFGVSVIVDAFDKKNILEERKRSGRRRKIDIIKAQRKMLEYDFVQCVINGEKMKDAKDEEKRLRLKQKEMENERERKEREEKEWRENLTILQRIYLKIRFLILKR